MAARRRKELVGNPIPVDPQVEELARLKGYVATELTKADKSAGGQAFYGEDSALEVWKEVQGELAQVPGRLGVTDEEWNMLTAAMTRFGELRPRLIAARRLVELLGDTSDLSLHNGNMVFERISGALDTRPEFADRFPALLRHVREAGRKAARTRQAKKGT